MNHIVIDIETIATQRMDVMDYIAATVKPPATYKKPESIAEWHKEQGPGHLVAGPGGHRTEPSGKWNAGVRRPQLERQQ